MLHFIACFASLALQDPVPLSAPIAEVTVFPGSALVRRHADAVPGAGKLVLAGLPATMDPDSVRVRCSGAAVIGTETRERFEKSVPDARVEELRGRLRALTRDAAALQDELEALRQIEAHLGRLVAVDGQGQRKEPITFSPAVWARNLEYLTARMGENRAAQRALRERIDALDVQLADVKGELGRADAGQGVRLRDVVVELAGGAGTAALDVEYLVSNAGWTPLYDLRTAADARSVELSYRARVGQQTGEDWNDVALALSTAQPRLGAQGPDPQPVWLRAVEERKRYGYRGDAATGAEDGLFVGRALEREKADEPGKAAPAPRPFASVEGQGLSVRFRLDASASVPSRPEPATVLVGQQTLELSPEYFAAPELDPNVWLRGKCLNATPWTLLPGRAAVYFGADYLGQAQLERVQPGAELLLHLGPDPALTVERKALEDVVEGPGVFGTKSTHKQGFRIRVKNSGAAVARADGSALVFVREALPRSSDERIKVELADPKPKPSDDARWKKEREEQGVVTWSISVPRGGEALLEYVRRVSYPENATVIER